MKTATRDIRLTDGTFWNETFQLFHDKALTEPFDLTGSEPEITFSNGGPVLSEGEGLTVTPLEGKIVVGVIVSEQMNGHYRLNIKVEGEPQTPVWGKLTVDTQSS